MKTQAAKIPVKIKTIKIITIPFSPKLLDSIFKFLDTIFQLNKIAKIAVPVKSKLKISNYLKFRQKKQILLFAHRRMFQVFRFSPIF